MHFLGNRTITCNSCEGLLSVTLLRPVAPKFASTQEYVQRIEVRLSFGQLWKLQCMLTLKTNCLAQMRKSAYGTTPDIFPFPLPFSFFMGIESKMYIFIAIRENKLTMSTESSGHCFQNMNRGLLIALIGEQNKLASLYTVYQPSDYQFTMSVADINSIHLAQNGQVLVLLT